MVYIHDEPRFTSFSLWLLSCLGRVKKGCRTIRGNAPGAVRISTTPGISGIKSESAPSMETRDPVLPMQPNILGLNVQDEEGRSQDLLQRTRCSSAVMVLPERVGGCLSPTREGLPPKEGFPEKEMRVIGKQWPCQQLQPSKGHEAGSICMEVVLPSPMTAVPHQTDAAVESYTVVALRQ